MLQGVAAVTKLLHAGGLPPEETTAFLDSVRYDLTDATMRVYVIGEYSPKTRALLTGRLY